VRERYEGREDADMYDEEDYGEDSRFTDLPDAQRDPKLWLLKCKPGHEKDLMIRLMQKYLDSAHTDAPLSIQARTRQLRALPALEWDPRPFPNQKRPAAPFGLLRAAAASNPRTRSPPPPCDPYPAPPLVGAVH
jgi:hypothetical protein